MLSLKPFGCLPSTQSDGVQAAVVSRYPDMLFLPIETSGEGQINAYSRVQMTLAEAKVLARAEFDRALSSTGRPLGDIRAFVAGHTTLRHPFYPIPRRQGVAGVAANFVLHVGDLMAGRTRPRPGAVTGRGASPLPPCGPAHRMRRLEERPWLRWDPGQPGFSRSAPRRPCSTGWAWPVRRHHYPTQLSGGEQQRVAIARAFATGPRVLFADEPTGNLDLATGQRIADTLHGLREETGTALVLVTHDQKLADRCERRLLLVDGRLEPLA